MLLANVVQMGSHAQRCVTVQQMMKCVKMSVEIILMTCTMKIAVIAMTTNRTNSYSGYDKRLIVCNMIYLEMSSC